MPTTEAQRGAAISALAQVIRRLTDTPIDELLRIELGKDLNFEPLRISVTTIVDVLRRINTAVLPQLSHRNLAKLLAAINKIDAALESMGTFTVADAAKQGQNPIELRQSILRAFDQAEPVFWDEATPILALGVVTDMLAPTEEAREALARNQSDAAKAFEESLAFRNELESILSASRTAAAKVGVSQHSVHFAEEAKRFELATRKWLVTTALSAAVTLGAACVNVWYAVNHPPTSVSPFDFQLAVAKLIGFSFLLTATVWCGRVYRAALHNMVVNRHRQNALSSFEAFVAGATDDQTKNAVLLHATQSIFSPQMSGYVSGETEQSSTSHMVELVRTAGQGR